MWLSEEKDGGKIKHKGDAITDFTTIVSQNHCQLVKIQKRIPLVLIWQFLVPFTPRETIFLLPSWILHCRHNSDCWFPDKVVVGSIHEKLIPKISVECHGVLTWSDPNQPRMFVISCLSWSAMLLCCLFFGKIEPKQFRSVTNWYWCDNWQVVIWFEFPIRVSCLLIPDVSAHSNSEKPTTWGLFSS